MESPLLPSNDNAAPSLSSGPLIVEEESEFSRLIALSNPLSALLEDDYDERGTNPSRRPTAYRRRHFTTILAGFFCVVYIGCIWGSYTATAWSETHVQITLAWQEHYLPFLDDFTDQVVQTRTLATLLEDLSASGHWFFLMVLWAASLLLPCAYMILSPTLIVTDHERVLDWDQRVQKLNGRRCLELSARFGLVVVFAWVLVDLAVGLVQLEWTDTVVQMENRPKPPLGGFAIGMVCAMLVATVLRWPPAASDKTTEPLTPSRRFTPATETVTAVREAPRPAEPPAGMMVLEEVSELPPSMSPSTNVSGNSTETPEMDAPPQRPAVTSFAQRVIVFQLGVLSLLLWLPSMYLPVLRVSYRGTAADFLKSTHMQVFLWDIPFQASSGTWIDFVLELLHVITLIAIPLFCTCLCTLVWLGESSWSTPSKRLVFALQPCMGGAVWCMALAGTLMTLYPSITVHENVCQWIPTESCLSLEGKALPGAWFYTVHCIAMEYYVILTLLWG